MHPLLCNLHANVIFSASVFVSVRALSDKAFDGVSMLHVLTIGNTYHDAAGRVDVRAWLTNSFVALSQLDSSAVPVPIHSMGNDRTGAVIYSILVIVSGVPLAICRKEALLSSDAHD
jgi:hypothetical protein